MREQDDLEAFLREHGGLDGIAREVGQHDPLASRFEPAANENAPERKGTRSWLLTGVRSTGNKISALLRSKPT
jgi:hypothetical protein